MSQGKASTMPPSRQTPQHYGSINSDDTDSQMDGASLLQQESSGIPQDVQTSRVQAQNMVRMVAIISFTMIGYGCFYGTYGQWIYVRFEQDAFGANFSKINISASRDPCFRSNHNTTRESSLKSELVEAQANAARFGVYATLCLLIPSFFSNMLLGAYSDVLGRRFIFIVPIAGSLIRCTISWVVAFFELNVHIILAGNVIGGLCGDIVGLVTAVFLYTADNTSPGNSRSLGMVLAHTTILIFVALTSLANGFFIEAVGYVWSMLTGTAISGVMLIFCICFLRETLDKSKVVAIPACQRIKSVFDFYLDEPGDQKFKRSDFIILGSVFFLMGSALGTDIQTMYLMNEPFCWGAKQLGYVGSIGGLLSSIGSAVMTKLLQKLGMNDVSLCAVCLLSTAAQRFLLSFARVDWMVYLALTVGIMESPGLPIVRGILSKMVRQEKRGTLFASLAVIEVATLAISGTGMKELYANTVARWAGFTYFVLGCLIALSVVLVIIYKFVLNRRQKFTIHESCVTVDPGIIQSNDKAGRSKNVIL